MKTKILGAEKKKSPESRRKSENEENWGLWEQAARVSTYLAVWVDIVFPVGALLLICPFGFLVVLCEVCVRVRVCAGVCEGVVKRSDQS